MIRDIRITAAGTAWTVVLVLLGGCAPAEQQTDSTVHTESERPYRPGIRFEADTIAAGARIGELVLDSLLRRGPGSGRDADEAHFTGEIALAGSTMRHPDADLSRTAVCFEADSASAARLPRFHGDERRAWFCFANGVAAARSLAAPGEIVSASIVIDRFTIYHGYSDAVNSARLVRVVERPPAAVPPVAHDPAELTRAAVSIVAFLRGHTASDDIRLADSVTLYVSPEGGGARVRVARAQLRRRENWRIATPEGSTHRLIPPPGNTELTTRVGRHFNCREYGLASRYPELAALPHVGVKLEPVRPQSCLQSWNLTLVFSPREPRPTLAAIVYDQWEW